MRCECGDHAWAPLSKGYVVLVSPADEYLLDSKWSATITRGKTVYARRNIPKKPGDLGRHQELLHRVIVRPRNGYVVDHKNLNGLDNRRENLRECTGHQNMMNFGLRKGKKVPLKGVQQTGPGKFAARITLNKHLKYLGTFRTAGEAHHAYVQASTELHGEFARSE